MILNIILLTIIIIFGMYYCFCFVEEHSSKRFQKWEECQKEEQERSKVRHFINENIIDFIEKDISFLEKEIKKINLSTDQYDSIERLIRNRHLKDNLEKENKGLSKQLSHTSPRTNNKEVIIKSIDYINEKEPLNRKYGNQILSLWASYYIDVKNYLEKELLKLGGKK